MDYNEIDTNIKVLQERNIDILLLKKDLINFLEKDIRHYTSADIIFNENIASMEIANLKYIDNHKECSKSMFIEYRNNYKNFKNKSFLLIDLENFKSIDFSESRLDYPKKFIELLHMDENTDIETINILINKLKRLHKFLKGIVNLLLKS